MNTKLIAWITGTLTLLLALFSFVLSFNALTDLAAKHHVSIPYLFPLTVEAGVVIFSLNALYRSIHGEQTKWQWVLIIGSSLLAGTFNVLHAEPDLISQVIAAMPSLFLLLSFESFLNQVKHGVKRSNTVQSLAQLSTELNIKREEFDTLIGKKQGEFNGLVQAKQGELDRLVQAKQAEVDRLTEQGDRLRANTEQSQETITRLYQEIEQAQEIRAKMDQSSTEQRRSTLVSILTDEGDISVSTLANRLNTSRTTIYNDLDALCQDGLVRKNGNGWEVIR